jgi:hypothetical protein
MNVGAPGLALEAWDTSNLRGAGREQVVQDSAPYQDTASIAQEKAQDGGLGFLCASSRFNPFPARLE